MKNEVTDYNIDDLDRDKQTTWDGVRNYQARNFMRDDMCVGDLAFFYHSNADPSGVAGVMKIIKTKITDPTQFEKKGKYYDEKATKAVPRWFCVEVQFVKNLKNFVGLPEIKQNKKLKGILVAQKGTRLSVQPVSKEHFKEIIRMSSV